MAQLMFHQLAKDVLAAHGGPRKKSVLDTAEAAGVEKLHYEDALVRIDAHYNGSELRVVRMKNRNPVLIVENGEVVRYSAEAAYIAEHMMELVK